MRRPLTMKISTVIKFATKIAAKYMIPRRTRAHSIRQHTQPQPRTTTDLIFSVLRLGQGTTLRARARRPGAVAAEKTRRGALRTIAHNYRDERKSLADNRSPVELDGAIQCRKEHGRIWSHRPMRIADTRTPSRPKCTPQRQSDMETRAREEKRSCEWERSGAVGVRGNSYRRLAPRPRYR